MIAKPINWEKIIEHLTYISVPRKKLKVYNLQSGELPNFITPSGKEVFIPVSNKIDLKIKVSDVIDKDLNIVIATIVAEKENEVYEKLLNVLNKNNEVVGVFIYKNYELLINPVTLLYDICGSFGIYIEEIESFMEIPV